jgi:hypothetical protein
MTPAQTIRRATARATTRATARATTRAGGDGPGARARARGRRLVHRLADDAGAATAEYVVATMAAVGFAGLLIVILRGDEVRGILTELIRNALTVG